MEERIAQLFAGNIDEATLNAAMQLPVETWREGLADFKKRAAEGDQDAEDSIPYAATALTASVARERGTDATPEELFAHHAEQIVEPEWLLETLTAALGAGVDGRAWVSWLVGPAERDSSDSKFYLQLGLRVAPKACDAALATLAKKPDRFVFFGDDEFLDVWRGLLRHRNDSKMMALLKKAQSG